MKRCSTCQHELPASAFAARRASADGLQATCRSCNSLWAAAHRQRKLAVPPQVDQGEKWCRDCERVLPLAAFAKHGKASDGRQSYCRECFAQRYRAKRAAEGKLARPLDIPEGQKFCRSCRTTKPLADFGLRRSPRGDGRMSACKECRKVQSRTGYLKRKYGVTDQAIAELLEAQGGLCAICRTAEAVHVDHDHATGAVRGMLCFSCNAALGHFRDDPAVLRRAARYLEGSAHAQARDEAAWAAVLRRGRPAGPSPLEAAFAVRLADHRQSTEGGSRQ